MSIIHTYVRWVLGVFATGRGKRRADSRPAASAPATRPEAPRIPTSRFRDFPPRVSPSGEDAPLDGRAAALRPYVLEVEREPARQHRRRVALVLAADFGVDLDQHVVGAEGVA
ncbi:hypothetical protein C4B68_12045 [Streptomyces dengpaensis]|uniref:Uncharacterized protein n=1 Tax=Streptomyces dengpaensis TaxID=2049881 RepID=A0ABN5I0M3_9ACTN|nr:hypothetical protein [Streptomyces dengpaensis]AVH56386.1 hypothetical protein C4B68_12045 [Streptomyces dengpaensis]PIB05721.1 hypothetical protein B1C81_28220 [Streptomyces sp. HG99]